MINNKKTEDHDFGVDSRYKNREERSNDGLALMKARLERMKNLSPFEIIQAKLLQLKLEIEEFLSKPVKTAANHFTSFLSTYIDTIYDRRNKFAEDISISPVKLSQILNNHREPSEDFMLRLMVHSEKVFEKIGPFPNETWYHIYFHEKVGETLLKKAQWKLHLSNDVKTSNLVEDILR